MTIYWEPVDDDTDPDSIDVWHVADDGTQTDIGPADVSGVNGMPDSIGGIAPDAVRDVAADYYDQEATPGNSPSLTAKAHTIDMDMKKMDYVRGSPP